MSNKNLKQEGGEMSTNIQGNVVIINNNKGLNSNDVKDIAISVFMENFPKLQEDARREAEQNRDYFISELDNRIKERLNLEEINRFKKPSIQLALKDAIVTASCYNNLENRIILSNLIISRIKSDGFEFEQILFDEAIKNISRLTKNQIVLLTLIEATTNLVFTEAISNDQRLVLLNLERFLIPFVTINKNDIEHCRSFGLINSTFPNEWDRKIIDSSRLEDSILKNITKILEEYLNKFEFLDLKSWSLSPVGQVIASENLLNLIGPYDRSIKLGPQKLSDFKANNIIAIGDVMAYSSDRK